MYTFVDSIVCIIITVILLIALGYTCKDWCRDTRNEFAKAKGLSETDILCQAYKCFIIFVVPATLILADICIPLSVTHVEMTQQMRYCFSALCVIGGIAAVRFITYRNPIESQVAIHCLRIGMIFLKHGSVCTIIAANMAFLYGFKNQSLYLLSIVMSLGVSSTIVEHMMQCFWSPKNSEQSSYCQGVEDGKQQTAKIMRIYQQTQSIDDTAKKCEVSSEEVASTLKLLGLVTE